MKRVEKLRQQACVLRSLVRSLDDEVIQKDLSLLADRCEEMAAKVELAIVRGRSRPIDDQQQLATPTASGQRDAT